MKIAIECKSPLLQKSLENFLEGHLSSIHSADLIITDEMVTPQSNIMRVGSDPQADIIKPFSKAQLFLKLDSYYKSKEDALEAMNIVNEVEEQTLAPQVPTAQTATPQTPTQERPAPIKPRVATAALEEKIERLTQQYIKGVMSLVKEHYEK